MRKPFINFTNHPSAHWNPTQTVCARQYGEIEDIPFPDIPPEMTQDELYALAEQYLVRLLSKEPCCVLCQGESVFTALMVSMLIVSYADVFYVDGFYADGFLFNKRVKANKNSNKNQER